jgi:hypothetical protein
MMKMMGGAGFGPTEDDDFVAPVSSLQEGPLSRRYICIKN